MSRQTIQCSIHCANKALRSDAVNRARERKRWPRTIGGNRVVMPREIYPSSYVCDCGAECDHFENTIRELKEMSRSKRQTLVADDQEHRIIFRDGEFSAMWCPKEQKEIPANNTSELTS